MKIVVMYSTHRASAEHVRLLEAVDGAVEVAVVRSEAEAVEAVADAEVVLGHRFLRQCLPHARRLRWVQSTAGGVDRLPVVELAATGATLSRMTIFSDVIARHAVTMAWAICRSIPWAARLGTAAPDPPPLEPLPAPRRAVVFGTGPVGSAIARTLGSDGIHVTGVRRTRDTGTARPGFDQLHAVEDGDEALLDADWCFLALPRTAATEGLFDRGRLTLLKEGAVLVNVGRGETVDLEALLDALGSGHLGGAGLDVLPRTPELASLAPRCPPNLLVTPHSAAHCHDRGERIERFCEQQVRALLAGREPQDTVDLAQEIARLPDG